MQIKPTNTATSIRVLSPGDDGDVTQSNNAVALGIAANGNRRASRRRSRSRGVAYGSDYTQIAGQEAGNYQKADADATAVQVKPTNTVTSIRVLSPGDDGDVTQSNNAVALGAALNLNDTEQTIDQQQTGSGHGSDYLQVAGQGAWSGQHADVDAKAIQLGAKNEYTPVRVGSPNGKDRKKHGKGEDSKDAKTSNGGSVEQSNSVGAFGLALNLNKTHQPLTADADGPRLVRPAGRRPRRLVVAGRLGGRLRTSGGDALEEVKGGAHRRPLVTRGRLRPSRLTGFVHRRTVSQRGEGGTDVHGDVVSAENEATRGHARRGVPCGTGVAALAGPAWAGRCRQPTIHRAGPRSEASPQIAEAPTKASSLPAQATPAIGAEASTPTPDAPRRRRGSEPKPRAESRPPTSARSRAETAAARTPAPRPTSTPTPQPAPTYGSGSEREQCHAGAGACGRPSRRRPRQDRIRPIRATSDEPKKTAAPATVRCGAAGTATASACRSGR